MKFQLERAHKVVYIYHYTHRKSIFSYKNKNNSTLLNISNLHFKMQKKGFFFSKSNLEASKHALGG